MTIPQTLTDMLSTLGKYKLTDLEISIQLQHYCKVNNLIFEEGNGAVTIYKRGVTVCHSGCFGGLQMIDTPVMTYQFHDHIYHFGFIWEISLN